MSSAEVYQRSKACIIPFTGGSARHPVSCAMVNATPVIATRAVDIPEYLGDLGIYVDGSAESIADAIVKVESGAVDMAPWVGSCAPRRLRNWIVERIAEDLSGMYAQISARDSVAERCS